MKMIVMLLITIALANSAFGAGKEWSKVECGTAEEIASEILIAEASGWRLRSPKSSCLKQNQFKYLRIMRGYGADDDITPPPRNVLRLDEGRPFELIRVITQADGLYRAEFKWVIKEGKVQRTQTDSMIFKIMEGPSKELFGCAGLMSEPEQFAVRPSCQ